MFQLLDDADAVIAAEQSGMASQLEQQCPDFDTLYGQTSMSLLTDMGKRATCMVAAIYVQNTILCSPPH